MPGRIAPLVSGWQRRMGAVASPFGATGETSNGNPVQIEAYINGSWVDITSYVMVRDNNGNVSINRGRKDEGSTTEQSTCQLTLNNRDGRWSPRNPMGAYYGYIGRNTPIRISVPDGLGGKSYRFQGEVSVWPQSWDPTGTDVWTEIEGSGILRRLSQGPAYSHSVLYNTLTNPISPNLRAYWPMEDAADSTSLSSPLVNGSRMSITGTPTLAGYDGFPASDPVPLMESTTFSGGVARYDDPSAMQVRFFCFIPADGILNGTVVCSIDQAEFSFGNNQFWELYYSTTSKSFTLRACASDGTNLGADLTCSYDIRGKKIYVSVEFQESGANVSRAVRLYDLTSQISYDVTDTAFATQLTRVTKLQFGPASRSAIGPTGSTGLSECAIGHATVESVITSNTVLGVYVNPVGETAGRRIQRICGEQGIAFESLGDLDDTVDMGNQGKQNPLDLMQECEAADDGMLYESMPVLGLGYRTRNSLSNQDAQLTLNYTGFNLSEVPTPVEDDRYIQNQVTVTVNGVSQTYTLDTGTLSTQLPPAGVGVYGQELTLNLADSGQALSQAAWHVHLGTVDEPRYPQISVNLAHSTFVNNPALKQAVLGLRQGDRIVVQNPPSWLPPGDIDQIVLGFTETITHFEHHVTFVCAPASPYNSIDVLDTGTARVDTDGSQLVANITSSDVVCAVAPTDPYETVWTKDPNDFPFDIRVDGEVIRVTSIQDLLTDTFTRTVSSGWGTGDTGLTWTTSGGSATDYSVGSGVGATLLGSVNTSRRCILTTTIPDMDLYTSITADQLATGDFLLGGLVSRYLDSNNLYSAQLRFTTSNTVLVVIIKRVNGTETTLGSYTMPATTFVAGTFYRLRFKLKGTLLRAKGWLATDNETPEWQVVVYDNDLVLPSSVGIRSISGPGSTNVNPSIQYDNLSIVSPQVFNITRSINGIVKSHSTGADVRLAVPTIVSL